MIIIRRKFWKKGIAVAKPPEKNVLEEQQGSQYGLKQWGWVNSGQIIRGVAGH